MEEEWRDVIGYDYGYKISNLGRLKRISSPIMMKSKHGKIYPMIRKEKILKTRINKYGYERTVLSRGGKHYNVYIARLVAIAFIPNPYDKSTINHKDGNKLNNNMINLEWCTPQENMYHAKTNGLMHYGPFSEEHKLKLSIAQKGKPSKLKGTRFTKEHCEKISKALTGIKRSRETIEKSRLKKIGTKATDESREKMRQAHLKRWAKIKEQRLYDMES